MKCEIYSSMEWIYPDQMQENGTKNVNLYVAEKFERMFPDFNRLSSKRNRENYVFVYG